MTADSDVKTKQAQLKAEELVWKEQWEKERVKKKKRKIFIFSIFLGLITAGILRILLR